VRLLGRAIVVTWSRASQGCLRVWRRSSPLSSRDCRTALRIIHDDGFGRVVLGGTAFAATGGGAPQVDPSRASCSAESSRLPLVANRDRLVSSLNNFDDRSRPSGMLCCDHPPHVPRSSGSDQRLRPKDVPTDRSKGNNKGQSTYDEAECLGLRIPQGPSVARSLRFASPLRASPGKRASHRPIGGDARSPFHACPLATQTSVSHQTCSQSFTPGSLQPCSSKDLFPTASAHGDPSNRA